MDGRRHPRDHRHRGRDPAVSTSRCCCPSRRRRRARLWADGGKASRAGGVDLDLDAAPLEHGAPDRAFGAEGRVHYQVVGGGGEGQRGLQPRRRRQVDRNRRCAEQLLVDVGGEVQDVRTRRRHLQAASDDSMLSVGEELAPARHLSHRVSEVAVSSATGRAEGLRARSEQARPSGWLHVGGRQDPHPGRARSPTPGITGRGCAVAAEAALATRGRSARVAPGGTERCGDGATRYYCSGTAHCHVCSGTGVQGDGRVCAICGGSGKCTHCSGGVMGPMAADPVRRRLIEMLSRIVDDAS